MRRYPTLSDICEAMTSPRSCLYDQVLAHGTVKKDSLGQAKGISGGFAIVFKLTDVVGKDWAIRVFHRDCPERDSRYTIITKQIQALRSLPYFLPFQYQSRGIMIGGETFPILKMAWLEGGEDLNTFITKHLSDRGALQNLRVALMRLHADLTANGVAHGDIQPGNVRVFDGGRKIRLLDYDGLFCDELSTLGPSEVGCPNYQHPQRAAVNYWDVGLDNFSFMVLDVALKLVMVNPKIWTLTDSENGEACVFRNEDYSNPRMSRAFILSSLQPGCDGFVRQFEKVCQGDIRDVPGPGKPQEQRRSAPSPKASHACNSTLENKMKIVHETDGGDEIEDDIMPELLDLSLADDDAGPSWWTRVWAKRKEIALSTGYAVLALMLGWSAYRAYHSGFVQPSQTESASCPNEEEDVNMIAKMKTVRLTCCSCGTVFDLSRHYEERDFYANCPRCYTYLRCEVVGL